MRVSYDGDLSAPAPQPQSGGSPYFGSPLLLIRYIRQLPSISESLLHLRTCHSVVTMDPDMAELKYSKKCTDFDQNFVTNAAGYKIGQPCPVQD